MRLRVPILTLFAIAASIHFSALGAVTRWTLSGVTFSDGGTAEGYLDLDPSGVGANGTVKNWQIIGFGRKHNFSFPDFIYIVRQLKRADSLRFRRDGAAAHNQRQGVQSGDTAPAFGPADRLGRNGRPEY